MPPFEPFPFGSFDVDVEGSCEVDLGTASFEEATDSSEIRSRTLGGKTGSSGCRIEAWRRRETSRACGRVEKYARF